MKPKILDLFSGAGGSAMGYSRAGFDVVGVDIDSQPRYPFEFYQTDAFDIMAVIDSLGVQAVHASPPCQDHSPLAHRHGVKHGTQWMLLETLKLIEKSGLPFIIENAERANIGGGRSGGFVTLCGSSFGLKVRRHRSFATSFAVEGLPCDHAAQGTPVGVYGKSGGSSKRDGRKFGGVDVWREAMGIEWMTAKELAQAVPPAYTEYLGRQLIGTL